MAFAITKQCPNMLSSVYKAGITVSLLATATLTLTSAPAAHVKTVPLVWSLAPTVASRLTHTNASVPLGLPMAYVNTITSANILLNVLSHLVETVGLMWTNAPVIPVLLVIVLVLSSRLEPLGCCAGVQPTSSQLHALVQPIQLQPRAQAPRHWLLALQLPAPRQICHPSQSQSQSRQDVWMTQTAF